MVVLRSCETIIEYLFMALDLCETINWYQDVVSHKSEATARYQFMV